MRNETSFHNTIDGTVRPFQTYTIEEGWQSTSTMVALSESVGYQFYPFFHPYVGRDRAFVANMKLSLMQRLNDGGVTELLGSDTLYMPQPNPTSSSQPLQVLTNSTQAVLAAN